MSSLLAHVAAGLTLHFCHRGQQPLPRVSMAIPVLLAIAPDFDYFGIWFFHLRYEQRFTHSLLFCLLLSSAVWFTVWLLPRRCWPTGQARPVFWILLPAVCSHLVLDLLVGRSLPLLWPFVPEKFSLPLVLLPGMSHTGLISFAFWRNLILEACLLLPMLAVFIMTVRGLPWRAWMPEIVLVLAMWSGLVFASSSLLL